MSNDEMRHYLLCISLLNKDTDLKLLAVVKSYIETTITGVSSLIYRDRGTGVGHRLDPKNRY